MSEAPGADDWLAWAQRLRAISQTGLAYSRDGYDLERFEEIGAIAGRMLAAVSGVSQERIEALYLPERGYPTPKVDVRAGVFRSAGGVRPPCVLLVQEAGDGRWSLPGGWADEHESPRQCVEREVREESGYQVRAVKLVAVKDRSLHPYRPRRLERIYKLFFVCELTGGAPEPSLETTAARFFALDDLPPLSVGRTLSADIGMLAAHHQEPSLSVLFD